MKRVAHLSTLLIGTAAMICVAGCLVQPVIDDGAHSDHRRPLKQLVHCAVLDYARRLANLSDEVAGRLQRGEIDNEQNFRDLLAERVKQERAKAWQHVNAHWDEQLLEWDSRQASQLLKQQAEGYRNAARGLRKPSGRR